MFIYKGKASIAERLSKYSAIGAVKNCEINYSINMRMTN